VRANEKKVLEISKEDIQAIQLYFPDCSFRDVGYQEALKRTASCDVHACPGSGKTTLLVAKLAILASKWDWRGQGICVLSHTNVARLEVETRLARHPTMHGLLSYPHFIGTIQSFVDRFLAIPYLRSRGIEVYAIDNERFSRQANRLLLSYGTARQWLRMKCHGDDDMARNVAGTLRYEGDSLRIGLASKLQLPSETTTTYKQMLDLKVRISEREGVFRFDDMYAFGEAYITEYPFTIDALTARFPWVFIDEMQDTNEMQERLLERIFGTECVVQRFGDINQAIYSGEEDTDGQGGFPGADVIDLPDSWRFGPEIAALTSNLTVKKKQTLVGRFENSEHHTLFVFRNETIHGVLPAFAELILSIHDGQLPPGFVVKAVGFRRSGANNDPAKIPFNIGDYWDAFQSDFVPSVGSTSTLLGYVAKARHLVEGAEEVRDGYGTIMTGILRLLHTEGDRDSNGRRFSSGRLMDTLEAAGEMRCLQRLVAELCVRAEPLDQQYWANACEELVRLRTSWDSRPLSAEGQHFLQWEVGGSQPPNGVPESSGGFVNVFHHRGVAVEVGTIHKVKGETHGATLVLETFMRAHDLKALLPYLSGEQDVTAAVHDHALVRRMQPVFVGMTRPRRLVCLAMHRDHLSGEYEAILRSRGWHIQEIS